MTRPLKSAAWLAVSLIAAAAASASAQTSDILADPMDGVESGPRELGSYGGVKAGGEQMPAIPANPGTTPAAITWPGFQMQPNGGSRVFLQATAAISVQARSEGKLFLLDLGSALIAGDTNALPLDTRFFNTPVTRIALERVQGRTMLVLHLRQPVTPTVSSQRAASGFHFIYVDFPAGSYVKGVVPPAASKPAGSVRVNNKPAAQREPPSHLSGEIKKDGKVDTSHDNELPPGMGKLKGEASGSTDSDSNKASGQVEGGASFSL